MGGRTLEGGCAMGKRDIDEDPRRMDQVKKYQPHKFSPDELPPDYMALLSLVLGIAGLMMKMKILAWLAFLACVSSIANMKNSEADMKQLFCSFSFSVMGLVMSYIAPR